MVGRLIRMDLCGRFRSWMKVVQSKQQRKMLAEQHLFQSTQQATYFSYFYQQKLPENRGLKFYLYSILIAFISGTHQ
jgi:hypothetical protein